MEQLPDLVCQDAEGMACGALIASDTIMTPLGLLCRRAAVWCFSMERPSLHCTVLLVMDNSFSASILYLQPVCVQDTASLGEGIQPAKATSDYHYENRTHCVDPGFVLLSIKGSQQSSDGPASVITFSPPIWRRNCLINTFSVENPSYPYWRILHALKGLGFLMLRLVTGLAHQLMTHFARGEACLILLQSPFCHLNPV